MQPTEKHTQYRLLTRIAGAPHVGKAVFAALALFVVADVLAETSGRIDFVTAGFLGFAGLTGALFVLTLYDLAVSVLRLAYRPAGGPTLPEPFQIASDVALEYVRWLSPLGFVVGIVFGHYFWQ